MFIFVCFFTQTDPHEVEDVKRMMAEQEDELLAKVERVQQYVKERQAGALHAETMQAVARSDVSKAQEELRRVIADREKMQRLLLDAEDRARETAAKYEHRIAEIERARKAAEDRATAADRSLRNQNAELLEKQHIDHTAKVGWVANKRFEISKFKFEFPRARTYEMIGLVRGCIEAKFCK